MLKFSHGLIVIGLIQFCGAKGAIKLAGLFTDNMVLQRNQSVPIWGWAGEGERVIVHFREHTLSATTRDGKWKVTLPRLKEGGPDTLTVTGQNHIELKNVLVGEVWICSGQSNMEWPLSRSYESKTAMEGATNPNIRLFTVPKLKSDQPVSDVKGSWQPCTPETVPSFSAVAYFFGRDLQKALNVPIGLIHTSWGGSPAEVWMRQEILERNADYKQTILGEYTKQYDKYQENLKKWEEETSAPNKALNRNRPGAPWKPAELYNGMIAPLIPYGIKGAIWYQGESNAGRALQYRNLFADMITNWRQDWGLLTFTFLEVQLAPYDQNRKRSLEAITEKPGDSSWAELREAQLLATKQLPKVGMAVITDVGDKDDIHPTKKEPVGARLALAARGIAYGDKIVYSGPAYKKMRVKDGQAIVSFDDIGSGLEAKGGELKGFAIAGADKNFVWAKAEIEGNTVIVRSPEVSKAVAVRYGWADFPVVNLWNKEGLPASPFRTDDFPMVTDPKGAAKQ